MFQIRQNVFESNSSSTHSICISKQPVDYLKCNYVDFRLGEYGWEHNEVNAANYLYTAIMCAEADKRHAYMERLKYILDYYGIKYAFESPKFKQWGSSMYLENGGIDHSHETTHFVEAVLVDEDMLMRLLFGDSTVYIGNDNYWEKGNMCDVAYEYSYLPDEEIGEWRLEKTGNWDHPAYDPDNYDYFYKGN